MEIDEKISVRFQKRELNELDQLVEKMGYSSRSEFIRQAVDNHKDSMEDLATVQVEIPPLVLDYIDTLVEKGYYRSREDALHKAIDHYFDHERIESAMKAAKGMEKVTGRSMSIIEKDGKRKKIIEK